MVKKLFKDASNRKKKGRSVCRYMQLDIVLKSMKTDNKDLDSEKDTPGRNHHVQSQSKNLSSNNTHVHVCLSHQSTLLGFQQTSFTVQRPVQLFHFTEFNFLSVSISPAPQGFVFLPPFPLFALSRSHIPSHFKLQS